MKKLIILFIVLSNIFLFINCKKESEDITSPIQETNDDTLVVINTINSFTLTVNAKEFSTNRTDRLTFSSDTLVIALTITEFVSGTGNIIISSSDSTELFNEVLNDNKKIIEKKITGKLPFYISTQMLNFTGKISFVVFLNKLEPIERFNIDTNVTWSREYNPIVIDKDVIVDENGVLEIQAGTIIEIVENSVYENDPAGGYYRDPFFNVFGTILCRGDSANKIIFKSASQIQPYGEIQIFSDTMKTQHSSIEGIELKTLWWWDGFPSIKYSQIDHIVAYRCKEVKIISNNVAEIDVLRGNDVNSVIEKNIVSGQIHISSNSILINKNIINNSSNPWGAIFCQNNSRSQIINNVIENCDIAFFIFSASPEIHGNNIINNNYNMVLLPSVSNAESDTINAINNWWGIADSIAIQNKIEYRYNGNTISNKKVLFVPFSVEPIVF